MAAKSNRGNYLIFHPEKLGVLDVLSLFFSRRRLTSYKFVEASSSTALELGGATATWSTALTLFIQKILLDFGTILRVIGFFVEFVLNFVSLNGGLMGTLWHLVTGSARWPNPSSAEYRSVIGHIDGRLDLYKSKSLLNYFSLMNPQQDFQDVNMLDLSMMASKVAYENPAYVENAVKNHWKMNFIRFFSCWNDLLQAEATQAFMFSDKPMDANLICVAFRGTEPFDVNDWLTDIDLSLISLNTDKTGKNPGRVHMGFLGGLGLLKNFNPGDVFPVNQPQGIGHQLAYYRIRETLAAQLIVHPNAKILVTGHSLGGALAILFPFLLYVHNQTAILNSMYGVMTYGQPRVGDNDFASYMEAYAGLRHERMVYRYDIVPRVPLEIPLIAPYKHSGTCIYYKSWYEGQVVDEVPNPNYFDPKYLLDKYANAWGDLIKALFIGVSQGPDYKESFVSIVFRLFGLIIPGVASHSPRDYVNAGRLASISNKIMV